MTPPGDAAGPARRARAALIAVQLGVDELVLATPERYRGHVEDAVARALRAAEAADPDAAAGRAAARLVVLPELAGHLGLLALAPPAAKKAKTLGAALAAAAVRRPLDVLHGVATARTLHPRHAMLAALAPDGERYWRGVIGPLARRHGAYIAAGSHLRLRDAGDLTSASLLFAPDGRSVAVTDKVNLVPGLEDGGPRALGLARGEPDRIPICETPLGRVATLIGYDGFLAPHTTLERFLPVPPHLAARGGVDVVANPAANPWPWIGPWPPAGPAGTAGQPGQPGLHDPAPSPPGSRAAQWAREGLPAGLAEVRFARHAVTAHLVGEVLELRFDGASEILEQDHGSVRALARAPHHDRAGHVAATVAC